MHLTMKKICIFCLFYSFIFLYKFSENETKPIFSSMERKTTSFCSIPLLSSSFLLRYIRYTYTFQNHILKYIIMITIMNYSVEVHYGLLHLILKFIFINSAIKTGPLFLLTENFKTIATVSNVFCF